MSLALLALGRPMQVHGNENGEPEVTRVYERVLLPIDGSRCSEQAVRWGLDFAVAVGAEVTFLHVSETSANLLGSLPTRAFYWGDLRRDIRAAGKKSLEYAEAEAAARGVAYDACMLEDKVPAHAILEAEQNHQLTLMATHSRRGLDRLFLGSVTEAVLRRSDQPHLILHCPAESTLLPPPSLEHFLLPIDGSLCSTRATEEGVRLAEMLGAKVTFLYALETPFAVYPVPELLTYEADIRETLKGAAQAFLEKAQRSAARFGVAAEVRLVEATNARVEETILAAEEGFGLTVMGTHGRCGLGRALLGSVTEGVLRRSPSPHLVVRCLER